MQRFTRLSCVKILTKYMHNIKSQQETFHNVEQSQTDCSTQINQHLNILHIETV